VFDDGIGGAKESKEVLKSDQETKREVQTDH
jgi:hypothetical protein